MVRSEVLHPRAGQHLVGHRERRHGFLSDLAVLRLGNGDRVAEVGCGHGQHVGRLEAREKRAANHRAIVEGDVAVAEYRRAAGMPRVSDARQRRSEKEESDPALEVEAHDLREDGERRIVDHDAVGGVLRVRVVAAGEERAHRLRAVDAVTVHAPRQYCLVHVRRRVRVVARVARLELVDELVVLLHGRDSSTSP